MRIADSIHFHTREAIEDAMRSALELMEAVELPEPLRADCYPKLIELVLAKQVAVEASPSLLTAPTLQH